MKFKERTFPHPVLDPTGKDVPDSAFQANCKITVDKTAVYVHTNFVLSNATLRELIETDKAKFVVHADCNAAFFRKVYLFRESECRIQIPLTEVKRTVDLSFFICATKPIDEYSVDGMDAIYDGATFRIQIGDILAYGEGVNFSIFDRESLSKIASIMLVREGQEDITIPVISFDEDKIAVSLPPAQFALYAPLKIDIRVKATMLNAVILPVLVEAVQQVLKLDDNDEMGLYTWYRVLKYRIAELSKKPEIDGESAYCLAQNILAGVSEKALNEINDILTLSE